MSLEISVSARSLLFRGEFLPSVTIPRVPSAPMKSFVVSNPAEDLRARLRVLMTSPDGRTTVCKNVLDISWW